MTQTNKNSHIEDPPGNRHPSRGDSHVIVLPRGWDENRFSLALALPVSVDQLHPDAPIHGDSGCICAQACQSGFLRYVYEEKGISLARTDGSGRHALFLDPIHNAGHQPERKPSGYMENIRIPIHDLLVSAILFLMFAAIRMIDANKWMDKFGGWAICSYVPLPA